MQVPSRLAASCPSARCSHSRLVAVHMARQAAKPARGLQGLVSACCTRDQQQPKVFTDLNFFRLKFTY